MPGKTLRVVAKLTAVALLGAVLAASRGTPVGATTLQSTVLSPVDGHVSSNPDEPHHRPYGGDYAFDVHTSRTKRPVYARFRNTNGSLSLTVNTVARACRSGVFAHGGNKIVLNVHINGTKVGTVTYAHLTSIRYSSGAVPVGAHIGDVATYGDGLSDSSCWRGPHVHVEPRNDAKYGCFFRQPLGTAAGSGTPLGLIGGERAAGANVRCPAGAETPNVIGEGSFISHGGHVYRIAGGAPIYVSSWNVFGGVKPTTPVASLSQFRKYPADGTFVGGGNHIYRFAGGAPIYVSNWDAVGGVKPAVAIDPAAISHADGPSPWNHIRRYPVDGTFIVGKGTVYRVAGGAPIWLSSWSHVGGQKPSTAVDPAAISNAGRGGVWDHLRKYPRDGTQLKGAPSGDFWTVHGGQRSPALGPSGIVVSDSGLSVIPRQATTGTVWGVNGSDQVFRRSGSGWKPVTGRLVQVDVGLTDIWGVNRAGRVYQYSGVNQWSLRPGRLKQVSVGTAPGSLARDVWGVNSSGFVYRWVGGKWSLMPGRLAQVGVGYKGEVWGVNSSGYVYRWTGSGWQRRPGSLKQVSVGIDSGGSPLVWGVNRSGYVYRWEGSGWGRISGRLDKVDVGRAEVWGVNSADRIYRYAGANRWSPNAGRLKQISAGL